uniref:Uncharacterized protein n=1 Tax=Anguilla anguilla TaxID=7936 RepID=A0A0E9U472_ANGAN
MLCYYGNHIKARLSLQLSPSVSDKFCQW